jgi:uncharacterized protein (TIGR03067 family)
MYASLTLSLAFAIAAPAPKDSKFDPAQIVGVWMVQKVDSDAKDIPPEGVIFRIEKDKIFVKEGKREREEEANYTLDTTQKPIHIDISPAPPKGANIKELPLIKGIIEIEKDTIKLCFAKDAKDRPTEFKSNPEKNAISFTMKRAEKK